VFRKTEDLEGYFLLMRDLIKNHGIPVSIYHDKHTIFRSPKEERLSIEEELLGIEKPLTQFGRAMKELGIIQIYADSPQAKGRIERLFGTLQSRLKEELKIEGIKDIESSNIYLKEFIERYNKKFSVEPKNPISSFRKEISDDILEEILCRKEMRKVLKGSVISYGGKLYFLKEGKETVLLKEGSLVSIHIHGDGTIKASYGDKIYQLEPALNKERKEQKVEKERETKRKRKSPSKDHPWKKYPLLPRR